MRYHAKRFRADLRGIRLWMTAVALATFVISAVATYTAAFGLTEWSSGTLSTQPPHEPLGFIRVVDPATDIVQDLDTYGDQVDYLDTPGMAVLLERMEADDRLLLAMPLAAVTHDLRIFSQSAASGQVVVGAGPVAVPDDVAHEVQAPLWGPVPDVVAAADGRLGPVPVRQVSSSPANGTYVDGNGRRHRTNSDSLLVLTTDQIRALGVYFPYSVIDLTRSLTCYCDMADTAELAAEMTAAERRSGTDRVFYAVAYDGLVGPSERSGAVTEALLTIFPAATALSVFAFAGIATLLLWRRREPDYGVERHCGAGETALQARQQIIVLIAVTLPAVAGFIVVDLLIQPTEPPPPWSPFGGPVAPLLALALHVAVGAGAAVNVHRICRPSEERGLHV